MEEVKAKLKEELAELEEELHHKLPKEIQKAREFGDLRENAEYKAALERQSIVKARITRAGPTMFGWPADCLRICVNSCIEPMVGPEIEPAYSRVQ